MTTGHRGPVRPADPRPRRPGFLPEPRPRPWGRPVCAHTPATTRGPQSGHVCDGADPDNRPSLPPQRWMIYSDRPSSAAAMAVVWNPSGIAPTVPHIARSCVRPHTHNISQGTAQYSDIPEERNLANCPCHSPAFVCRRRAAFNTVHFAIRIAAATSIHVVGCGVRGRGGWPLILRLTPRGMCMPWEIATHFSRISAKASSCRASLC